MAYLRVGCGAAAFGRSIDVSGGVVLQPRDLVDPDVAASDDCPRPTDAFAKR